MKTFAFDLYRFVPKNYFKYSQATLIYVLYAYNVYIDLASEIAYLSGHQLSTALNNNVIADNLNI